MSYWLIRNRLFKPHHGLIYSNGMDGPQMGLRTIVAT